MSTDLLWLLTLAATLLMGMLLGVEATIPGGARLKVPGFLPFLRTAFVDSDRSSRMKSRLPTHEQAFALALLADDAELTAEDINVRRAERSHRPLTKGALHNNMQKLVSERWVQHVRCKAKVGGRTVYYNRYVITSTGKLALQEVVSYYASLTTT